jgi:hypothetical protein
MATLSSTQGSKNSLLKRWVGYLFQVIGLSLLIFTVIESFTPAVTVANLSIKDSGTWVTAFISFGFLVACFMLFLIGSGFFSMGRSLYASSPVLSRSGGAYTYSAPIGRHPLGALFVRFLGWGMQYTTPVAILVILGAMVLLYFRWKSDGISLEDIKIKFLMMVIPAIFYLGMLLSLLSYINQAGRRVFVSGKKLGAIRAEEALRSDNRPPVLYLRSFTDDETFFDDINSTVRAQESSIPVYKSTEEELMAGVMDEIGPFVAIGRPGEMLPDLGAARLYVGKEWKQVIEDLIRRSRLIVMRAGDTSGFWWEFENVVKSASPEKILLLLPNDRVRYGLLRRHADQLLPKPLPEVPSFNQKRSKKNLSGLLYFERDWTPRQVPIKVNKFTLFSSYSKDLKWSLEPVFRQLGLPYRRPWVFSGLSQVVRVVAVIGFLWMLMPGLFNTLIQWVANLGR